MTKAQQLGITEFPYQEFDSNGKEIYYENSDGFWIKREYDSNHNRIYYEDSYGDIEDNRPKERMYSEKDMLELMDAYADDVMGGCILRAKEWFQQIKK
jgi:hypothetical protein